MGVLDALTILGAGIGRGYRGSQELQRQMAEEKRKALLDEREQILREQNARSQQALQEAQIQTEALNRAIGQFGLDVNKKRYETSQTPITQGGGPLKARILGQDVNLPGTVQTLTDQDALLRQLSEEKFKSEHPGYFMNYPPAGTAAAQIRNSPEARGREYIQQILTGNPAMELSEDAETYNTRIRGLMKAKLDFLNEQDPEALKALFGKTKSKGAESDTSYLDDEAIEPDENPKGKNRFKGIKVKPQGR